MLIRISRRTSGSSLAALVSLAGLIALAGCGSSGTHACPAVGCCAGSSDACVVPQALSANGLNGQIAVFPIQGGTGLPGSPTFTTGPGMSLGMAAFNNQFLYRSEER